MTIAPQLARELRPEARLRYRPASCLPAHFTQAACQRCADACPTAALVAGGGGPILGAGCVGCGRCAAACPTGALEIPGFVTPQQVPPGGFAVDCWRVPAADSPSGALRLPCLGGLSAAALLELTAATEEGAPELLDRGFCRGCHAGGEAHPIAAALAAAHELLGEMEVAQERWPRLVSRRLPLARMADAVGEPLLEERLSRRALLTGRATAPTHRAPSSASGSREVQDKPRAERERLFAALACLAPDRELPAWLFPTVAASDACANHQVCASVCPTRALHTYRLDDAGGIVFDAVACISCGLCLALCPEQALALAPGGAADAARDPKALTRHAVRACPDCGADYRGAGAVCPACQKDQTFARDAFQTLFSGARP